LKKRP